MENSINIRHMLILALGATDRLHPEIDKIYEENPTYYYETFRNSGFYQDMLMQVYPVKYLKYFEKTAAIVEHCYNQNQKLKLQSLIKKGYSPIYKLVQHNSTISHQKWTKVLFGDAGTIGYDQVSEMDLFNKYVIFIYLTENADHDLRIQGMELAMNFVFEYVKRNNLTLASKLNAQENLHEWSLAKEQFKHYFLSDQSTLNINTVLENYIEKELLDTYYQGKINAIPSPQDYQQKRSAIFSEGNHSSVIGFYSGILKNFGIGDFMLNQEISKNEMISLVHIFEGLYEENKIPIEEKQAFCIALMFTAMAKEYQSALSLAKPELEEFVWYENKKANEVAYFEKEQEIARLKKEAEALRFDLKQHKEALTDSEKSVKQLTRDVQRLNESLNETHETVREVLALRELFFELEHEEFEVRSSNPEKTIQQLNKRKIVFIGGHESWMEKMKETLPAVSFIDADEGKTRSLQFLNNFDYVVFNTSKNSHSLYKKVLANLHHKQRLLYLNSSYNIDKTIAWLENKILQ